MNCNHPIGYQEFDYGPILCLKCAPPASPPARIGIIQPDGTIMTKWDILAHMCECNRIVLECRLVRYVNRLWPEGEWELADPGPVDAEGWPKNSREWKDPPKFKGFCIPRS